MKISISISTVELADGTFKPEIELVEDYGSGANFTGFDIDESFPTQGEALENAKRHAVSVATEKYGDDTEVTFAIAV